MCVHDCPRHYYKLDNWLNGKCRCGCLITPNNVLRMLGNMLARRSRARSVLCINGVRISAHG